jgi:hypothetical protein
VDAVIVGELLGEAPGDPKIMSGFKEGRGLLGIGDGCLVATGAVK